MEFLALCYLTHSNNFFLYVWLCFEVLSCSKICWGYQIKQNLLSFQHCRSDLFFLYSKINRLLKLSLEVGTLLVITYSSNVKVEEDKKNPSEIQLMGFFLVFPLVLFNYFDWHPCMLTSFCSS